MAKGIMVCEGAMEGFVEQPTEELLSVWAAGFSAGADKYGAGGAAVLTRRDLEHLRPDNKYDAKDIALIEQWLPVEAVES